MIILLSPAKTLDFDDYGRDMPCTQPEFIDLSKDLINGLSKLTSSEVGSLMNISPKLADLNRDVFNSGNQNMIK